MEDSFYLQSSVKNRTFDAIKNPNKIFEKYRQRIASQENRKPDEERFREVLKSKTPTVHDDEIRELIEGCKERANRIIDKKGNGKNHMMKLR